MARPRSPRLTPRVWRVAIVASCLAFAALAMGSAADRLVTGRPDMAKHIPALFAAEALRSQGRQLLEGGDANGARLLGEAAVEQDPVDPGSTALLGAARFALNDRTGAERAFTVAGKLGWRVPLTQFYWMGRALEGGDYRVAGLRLDALLRQKPALLKDRRLLDPMESDPRGRTAMAERMLRKPNWLRAYTALNQELPENVTKWRAQTLIEMSRLGGSAGCERIAPIASRLIQIGEGKIAKVLRRAHCFASGVAIVDDGDFAAAAVDQARSDFVWFFLGQADIDALPQRRDYPAPSGLLIRGNAIRDSIVVRQLVFAPAGTYQLSWKAVSTDGSPTNRILASLGCGIVSIDKVSPTYDSTAQRWTATVQLDDSCEARWLKFGAAKGPTDGFLTEVELVPVEHS